MRLSGTFIRLFALTIVWAVIGLVGFYGIVGLNYFIEMDPALQRAGWIPLIVIVPLFVCGVIVSDAFLRLYFPRGRRSRMREMLTLLDDDDLDDLRAEMREGLRSKIKRLSDSDVESFDALLNDASGKRKRGER